MRLADRIGRFIHTYKTRAGPACDRVRRAAECRSGPEHSDLLDVKRSLERILTENIVPFWWSRTIDAREGGYALNHDLEGNWRGPANKHLVTQARTLWFFSRLANSPYGGPEHIEAARHGYEFLRGRMWDDQFGGFYGEVDSSGRIAAQPEKRLYGQAFALYALTEYARASGDPSPAGLAKELFELLEDKAHDKRHGGYREVLQREWTPTTPTAAPGVYLKRMDTHLHLLEAIATFFSLTGEPAARERLIELILVNSNSVVRKDIGACTEAHLEDWQPLEGANHNRVSFGHDVENIWLLVHACRTAELSSSLLLNLYRTLFNYALQYGFDRKGGGFYHSGSLGARADRREKVWWVQAEALIAALEMYELTGERLYWDCFSRTLDWIGSRQVDWVNGDWHEIIDRNGRPSGLKASPWKGPYHNGRAMLHCLDLLKSRSDGNRRCDRSSNTGRRSLRRRRA